MFGDKKRRKSLNLSKKRSKIWVYKNEMISILLAVFSLFLLISFVSYDPKDPSLFHFSSTKHAISNWAGVIGANLAAMFFYFFGDAAFLCVAILLFLAFVLISQKKMKGQVSNVFALILIMLSSATLLRFYNLDFSQKFAGGLVGDSFLNLLSYFMDFWGINFFLAALFAASLMILLKISIVDVCGWIAKFVLQLVVVAFKTICFLFAKLVRYVANKISILAAAIANAFLRGIKCCGKKALSLILRREGEEEEFVGSWRAKKIEPTYEEDDDLGDEELWNSLQDISPEKRQKKEEDVFDFESTLNSAVVHKSEVVERFKDKKVFCHSHHNKFGNYDLLSLPNSIFNQNILHQDFFDKLVDFADTGAFVDGLTAEPARVKVKSKVEYVLPDPEMFDLHNTDEKHQKDIEQECIKRGEKLEEKLSHFGIKGKVTAIRPGPVITLFEYKPEIDSKISKIISLEDDLAMALQAISIRIVAPIPGRSVVGFEISNQKRESVYLADVLLSEEFEDFDGKLPLNLGVDIVGRPVIQDLVSMPHLLVAGSTGSGKSVGLNAMLAGLLCKLRPDQLRLILIDPKRLEFSPFADIAHLIFPIITNPRKAAPVLKWLVQEMEDRYEKMAQAGVRNIVEYQKLAQDKPDEFDNMPFIVLMIDELADLMMVAGKEVETQIARIAQMARAAGIHMIAATQRPSVDVVTGLIKVNFPSRVAYRVSSKIDSRTIIDAQGAEKLLGKGDLLYMNSSSSDLKRIHGAYICEKEIESLTSHLRAQAEPDYLDLNEALRQINKPDLEEFEDDLYPQIKEFVKNRDEISISMLQRYYKIGFNRSAKIIERLELDGLIAPAQGSKPRKVLRS